MPAHSPFSSTQRFWLSALASLQSIVLMILGMGIAVDKLRVIDYRDQGCYLILALFVGVLSMAFLFRFVWKAMVPVVNERIPVWKKLIISVLSSMSAGQMLWIMGITVIYFILVMIRERLTDIVGFFGGRSEVVLEWVWYWKDTVIPNICVPICAGFAFVAMIWFGYKVYRRLSAAELIVAGDVGRKSGVAVRKTADDSSVKWGDGSAINPKR